MEYGIYQVKRDKMRDFGFLGFEDAERYNGVGSVRLENYDLVYEFGMESSGSVRLDDLYYIFNERRPEDFTGHSLSVSDVLKTPDGYFYCDNVGWRKLDWEE